jgi:tagatose-1,6-bisphosphate aldolase non-catalytic subunit AgaZ/GatZ
MYRWRKIMEYMERMKREEPEYWKETQEEERRRKNPAYNDKRWSEGNDLNNWIRNNRTRRFQTSLAGLDGLDEEEEQTLQREWMPQIGRSCQRGQAEPSDREWLSVAGCVFDILRLRVDDCLVLTHTHF